MLNVNITGKTINQNWVDYFCCYLCGYALAFSIFRLCMKYITETMNNMQIKNLDNKKEENVSIVERILLKTGNPKLAAVLALDLLLVGVDTVSFVKSREQTTKTG